MALEVSLEMVTAIVCPCKRVCLSSRWAFEVFAGSRSELGFFFFGTDPIINESITSLNLENPTHCFLDNTRDLSSAGVAGETSGTIHDCTFQPFREPMQTASTNSMFSSAAHQAPVPAGWTGSSGRFLP